MRTDIIEVFPKKERFLPYSLKLSIIYNKINSLQKGCVQSMDESNPKVLYHYCSLDTFYNIMKNRSIWLSDISKSNDSQELNWLTGQLKSSMSSHFFVFYNRISENGLLDAFNNTEYKKIRDFIDTCDLSKELKCWAFCMSEKSDDLGQWRGYADDGQGISLGFRRNYFEPEPINNLSWDNLLSIYGLFDKIEYGNFDVIHKFLTQDKFNEIQTTLDEKVLIQNFRQALSKTILLSPLYKNAAFQEEMEWRLACVMFTSNLLENSITPATSLTWLDRLADRFHVEQYAFSLKNQTLVSHIELKFKDIKSALHSVTIGPKSKLSELDIKLFLISLGLLQDNSDKSILVSKSSSSYQ